MTDDVEKRASRRVSKKAAAGDVAQANTLTVMAPHGRSRERLMAEVAGSAVTANGSTARTFLRGTFGELDLTEFLGVLRENVDKVKGGDLSSVEATLTMQAVSLDAIFAEMARRAALNMGTHLNATETYMRLALKAQSQCRATLQTLAEIKNPRPVAFVKQANIAQGPQQVNNGVPGSGEPLARAGKSEEHSNELLEAHNGERLDLGAPGTASGTHQDVAAVGTLDRAAE